MKILTSKWDGLNENLIASFFTVDPKGNRIGDIEVQAPLIDTAAHICYRYFGR